MSTRREVGEAGGLLTFVVRHNGNGRTLIIARINEWTATWKKDRVRSFFLQEPQGREDEEAWIWECGCVGVCICVCVDVRTGREGWKGRGCSAAGSERV